MIKRFEIKKTQNKKVLSFLTIFAIALGNAGSTLYLPALLNIGASFQTNAMLMKLSLSFYLISYGLSQLIYGPLSDAFGRRINLIVGISIFAVGSILASLSNDIVFFLFSRVVQGLGMGTANAVGYALLRDIYEGKELSKQISYASFFIGMVPIIAPVIGGFVTDVLNWRYCFYLLTFFSIILILAKHFWLPETNLTLDKSSYKPKNVIKNYFHLLKDTQFLSCVMITGLSFSCLMVANTILPYIICQTLKFDASDYGIISGISTSGYFIGAIGTSYLVNSHSKEKLLIHSISILFSSSLLGVMAGLFFLNLWVIIIPLFFSFLGIGGLIPLSASSALEVFSKQIGKSSALLGSFMFFGSSLFSAIASSLSGDTQKPMFALLLFLSILIMASIFSLNGNSKKIKT
jgi:Bcr/CflA subfamily drug resistance transporter